MATMADHYATHLASLYEWMAGDVEGALVRSAAELYALAITLRGNGRGMAVDLGAGIGLHSIPLAQRGYEVLAMDSNERLSITLRSLASLLPINCIHGDLLDFQNYFLQPADVIVCMGDTLTHLPNVPAVKDLFAAIAGSLSESGLFVATFRDCVTAPLEAERRFIPVHSGAGSSGMVSQRPEQGLTCSVRPELVEGHVY